jgi:hypothetical protein
MVEPTSNVIAITDEQIKRGARLSIVCPVKPDGIDWSSAHMDNWEDLTPIQQEFLEYLTEGDMSDVAVSLAIRVVQLMSDVDYHGLIEELEQYRIQCAEDNAADDGSYDES